MSAPLLPRCLNHQIMRPLSSCVVRVVAALHIYLTLVQYLQLVFTIFEVLEGSMHGGNELETSNRS
jgi:hypothetical protein